jgi:glyoxylase I family protein
MIRGIEHTAIASPDPERLAKWYVDHLDFQINYRSSNSKTHFVKAADGSMIEIIESKGASPGVSGMKDPGIRHMAILVTDFDAECARLKEKGVAILSEPAMSGGNSTLFFTDCDGNILHLLHREKPLG